MRKIMNIETITSIDTIKCLESQIRAILDLMQCCDKNIDVTSIQVSAEMCQTMLDEIMTEVEKMEKALRDSTD